MFVCVHTPPPNLSRAQCVSACLHFFLPLALALGPECMWGVWLVSFLRMWSVFFWQPWRLSWGQPGVWAEALGGEPGVWLARGGGSFLVTAGEGLLAAPWELGAGAGWLLALPGAVSVWGGCSSLTICGGDLAHLPSQVGLALGVVLGTGKGQSLCATHSCFCAFLLGLLALV